MGGRQSKPHSSSPPGAKQRHTELEQSLVQPRAYTDNEWDEVISRVRAHERQLFSKKQQLFEAASNAYKKGQGAEAKRLSRTAHQTDEKYRRARQEASVTILHLRNHGKPADTLDLHGQYVEEALSFTKQRLKELRNINNAQRTSSLLIITGAGHHSEDGRAKIRPAVLNFLRKKGYSFKEEGPGAFRVHLGAESTEGCFASLLRMLGLKK
jgi:DNA-nicking Smr family endonuclease